MKTLTMVLVVSAAPFLTPQSAPAQEPARTYDQDLNTKAYGELLKSDVRGKREMLIREVMQLNDTESKTFWPLFQQYDQERRKLDEAEAQLMREYVDAYQNISDVKADEVSSKALDLEVQRAQLKKTYFDKMKKALSPRVAARFFAVENQIQHLYELQLAANLPTNQ